MHDEPRDVAIGHVFPVCFIPGRSGSKECPASDLCRTCYDRSQYRHHDPFNRGGFPHKVGVTGSRGEAVYDHAWFRGFVDEFPQLTDCENFEKFAGTVSARGSAVCFKCWAHGTI